MSRPDEPKNIEKAIREQFAFWSRGHSSEKVEEADKEAVKNFPTLIDGLIKSLIGNPDYRDVAIGLSVIFISISVIISTESEWIRLFSSILGIAMLTFWKKKPNKNNRNSFTGWLVFFHVLLLYFAIAFVMCTHIFYQEMMVNLQMIIYFFGIAVFITILLILAARNSSQENKK